MLDEFARATFLGSLAPTRLVFEILLVARAHVFADQHLIAGKVLENDTQPLAQSRLVPLGQILAVEANPSRCRLIQTSQQLDERGFSRPVLADEREAFARLQMQVDVLQRGLFGPRILEADILKPDAILRVGTELDRAGRRRHRGFEILIERRQVQIVLVHAAYTGQHRRHGGLTLTEQRQVHGHLTEGDQAPNRADSNPRIRSVQGHGSNQAEPETPGITANGERPIFLVETPEDVAIAVQQAGAEAVELDLLRIVLATDHGLEVDLHARLRRTPAEQTEGIAREFCFADERR